MSGTGAPAGNAGSARSPVALIISLCINLLLVGIIATAFLRMYFFPPPFGGPGMMMHGHGPGHGLMLMQQALTPQAFQRAAPAKSEKIEAIMDAHRAKFRELGTASMEARRDAFKVFSQPTLDKKAFDDSLALVQAADAALEKEIFAVVSESAATLSPEERKAVAAERGHHEFFLWRHHFGHGFGPPPGNPPPPPDGD